MWSGRPTTLEGRSLRQKTLELSSRPAQAFGRIVASASEKRDDLWMPQGCWGGHHKFVGRS